MVGFLSERNLPKIVSFVKMVSIYISPAVLNFLDAATEDYQNFQFQVDLSSTPFAISESSSRPIDFRGYCRRKYPAGETGLQQLEKCIRC